MLITTGCSIMRVSSDQRRILYVNKFVSLAKLDNITLGIVLGVAVRVALRTEVGQDEE